VLALCSGLGRIASPDGNSTCPFSPSPFASRMREDTWDMLQRAAAKSVQGISQEFEFRLRRGLEDEKIEFGDLMKLATQRFPPNDRTRPRNEVTRIGRTGSRGNRSEIQAADPARLEGKKT
jgi:hypothetical protein